MYVFADFVFFFFKQKTAYEMRISDWSSDVCSSDLSLNGAIAGTGFQSIAAFACQGSRPAASPECPRHHRSHALLAAAVAAVVSCAYRRSVSNSLPMPASRKPSGASQAEIRQPRSEGHTSELQSQMRTPFAVFCLKK